MVTEVEKALGFEETEGSLEDRVVQLERKLALLLSDKAVGNVLKGPFRLPGHAKTSAFQ